MHRRSQRCRSASAAQLPQRSLRCDSRSALISAHLTPLLERTVPRFLYWVALCGAVVLGCGADEPATGSADARVGVSLCGGEQCAADEYCQRPLGFCSTAGNCEIKPTTCSDDLQTVCGCDGKSYRNRCVASSHNVSVERANLCNPDDKVIED